MRLAVLAYAVKSIVVLVFGIVFTVLTLGGWHFYKRHRTR